MSADITAVSADTSTGGNNGGERGPEDTGLLCLLPGLGLVPYLLAGDLGTLATPLSTPTARLRGRDRNPRAEWIKIVTAADI